MKFDLRERFKADRSFFLEKTTVLKAERDAAKEEIERRIKDTFHCECSYGYANSKGWVDFLAEPPFVIELNNKQMKMTFRYLSEIHLGCQKVDAVCTVIQRLDELRALLEDAEATMEKYRRELFRIRNKLVKQWTFKVKDYVVPNADVEVEGATFSIGSINDAGAQLTLMYEGAWSSYFAVPIGVVQCAIAMAGIGKDPRQYLSKKTF